MSNPNPKVLEAFLEVYLANRINNKYWSISDIDANTLNAAAKPGDRKLTTCHKLASSYNSAYGVYGWMDIVRELAKFEADERLEPTKSWLHYFHTPSMLLADTLRATRSYILYSIANELTYKNNMATLTEKKAKLEKELAELQNKKEPDETTKEAIKKKAEDVSAAKKEIEAFSTKEDYHHTFFTEQMLRKAIDPKVKELDEKNFEDFVKNVESGKRPNTYLDNLRSAENHVEKIREEEAAKAAKAAAPAQPPVFPDNFFVTLPAPTATTAKKTKKKDKDDEYYNNEFYSNAASPTGKRR